MSLAKLRRRFEDRRLSLIETLKKDKGELELSKQHQIYGAIKEIENFLSAIDYEREEDLKADDFELFSVQPKVKRSLGHVKERAKTVIASVRLTWDDKVSQPTRRAVRAAKRKVSLVKEVAREVKARSKETVE